MSDKLSLECHPFQDFFKVIGVACGIELESNTPFQVRYIESYLRNQQAGAKTILTEFPYIDRHWLDEYTTYYAKVLYPPRSHATRVHFFSRSFTRGEFYELVMAAATDDPGQVERDLARDYLGYVVIRPLPRAPIGRTILRT